MITLKTLSKSDIFPFHNWINDDDVIKYSLSLFRKINTEKEIENWYSELMRNENDITLGIFLESTNKLIGYAGICGISETNKSGEYYIFIGEKKVWGKGIGTKVTEQILKIGFNDYKLNRIMLTVSEPNIGGLKAYEKSGFKIEERLREACFRDNEFHDKLIMSILKSEWKKRKTTSNILYK
ncbi:GNAT family N-acetyltransferase [Flammeovirga pacifica]|uniref:GNAT family N-acetyltransferase n=1 Tax=Flammeovirga pacifica TaxID=915059 RepID=A0A1S1Z520_FLAPC|nr:GNAT family protein [Flammeovirga pacifica]OHX68386.1 GNAT family N-acetyltransferase [Flammeovirga pacifica]